MKKKKKLLNLVGASLALAMIASPVSWVPAQANSILIAEGFVHDSNGNPVSEMSVMLQSSSSSGQLMQVWRTTNLDGKFTAQAFPGEYNLGVGNNGQKCISKQQSGTLSSSNRTIEVELPAQMDIHFTVKSESGLPIANVQTGTLDLSFENGLRCSGQPSVFTDHNGSAKLHSFEGARASDMYDGWAGVAYYTPFEGVLLRHWISESEISSGQVSVILPDVPTADLSTPAITGSTANVRIKATLSNPDGSRATEASGESKRSMYKKVEVHTRKFTKGKWTKWKILKSASVGMNGKVNFSAVKFSKGKHQIRIQGKNFHLASKPRTIISK
jgi:hypothetical protein